MDKCECYYEQEKLGRLYNRYTGKQEDSYTYTAGICYGTKEQEECYCNGDRAKCTFYTEKRALAQNKASAIDTNKKLTKEIERLQKENAKLRELLATSKSQFICADGCIRNYANPELHCGECEYGN